MVLIAMLFAFFLLVAMFVTAGQTIGAFKAVQRNAEETAVPNVGNAACEGLAFDKAIFQRAEGFFLVLIMIFFVMIIVVMVLIAMLFLFFQCFKPAEGRRFGKAGDVIIAAFTPGGVEMDDDVLANGLVDTASDGHAFINGGTAEP